MSRRIFNTTKWGWWLLLAASLCRANAEPPAYVVASSGQKLRIHFDNSQSRITSSATNIENAFDLSSETFEVFVPKNYSDEEAFGIFVFMDSQNEMTMPEEWSSIMESEKLICLIPQKIGNDQPNSRRFGLTLVAILKAAERYRIDHKRIFTGGYSGGARCSLHLAFMRNDLIAGNISICGADFYEPVSKVEATNSSNYGVWPVPRDLAASAKMKTRFVFITGQQDFRHGNILDIYRGGFLKQGFHTKLIDDPQKGHQLCSPESLLESIHFLDGK